MKLDIGSGTNPMPGYVTVDPYQPDADYQAPMWDLPFDDGTVAAIYSSHALEHIMGACVVPTLAEWYRVLQPGGTLELRVPDLVWCVQNWLAHLDDGWERAKIFGSQEHEGNVHRTGFTRAMLRGYLVGVGFRIVEEDTLWTHAQQTLAYRAVKP